jgi:hypothetical protein
VSRTLRGASVDNLSALSNNTASRSTEAFAAARSAYRIDQVAAPATIAGTVGPG